MIIVVRIGNDGDGSSDDSSGAGDDEGNAWWQSSKKKKRLVERKGKGGKGVHVIGTFSYQSHYPPLSSHPLFSAHNIHINLSSSLTGLQ